MDNLELADKIISTFSTRDEVKAAYLNGSIACGTQDEFSDIDIIVDVSGLDNGKYLQEIPAIMERSYDVRFHYYACHRVPDIYVVSVFLQNVTIFQSIDIQCIAAPHCASVSRDYMRSIRDDVAGLLKGWVKHAAMLLREKDDAESLIRQYVRPRIGGAYKDSLTPSELLEALLNEIEHRAECRHYEFINECRKLLQTRLVVV